MATCVLWFESFVRLTVDRLDSNVDHLGTGQDQLRTGQGTHEELTQKLLNKEGDH